MAAFLYRFVSDFLPQINQRTYEYAFSLDNKTNYYLAIEHGEMVVKVGVPLKGRKNLRALSDRVFASTILLIYKVYSVNREFKPI